MWRFPVPPKVRLFAWKIITNSLLTWCNKERNLEANDQFPVCGIEIEDHFHPFFRCPHALALLRSMYEVWKLLRVEDMSNTGSKWLLHVASELHETECTMFLMILWRYWHIRTGIFHDKVPPPIDISRRFLCSYLNSLMMIDRHPEDVLKGKRVFFIICTMLVCHKEAMDKPCRQCIIPMESSSR